MGEYYQETVTESSLQEKARFFAENCSPGDIFLLEGDLGAGKTTFARHFIQTLMGAQESVPSPTFTLCQTYGTPRGPLCHYDLYRLRSSEELEELGFMDHMVGHILLIEWPEKVLATLGNRLRTRISLQHLSQDPTMREMTVIKEGRHG